MLNPTPRQVGAVTLKLLSDYFGDETKALAFARAHAGAVLKIPPLAVVEDIAKDGQVHRALAKDPSTPIVRHLADMTGGSMRDVAKRFTRRNGGKGLMVVRKERAACQTIL